MIFFKHNKRFIILAIFTLTVGGYYILHFNSLAVPSADYIGNFLPVVKTIAGGSLLEIKNKLLPAYPVVLALLYKTGIMPGFDPIYNWALVLNMMLVVPFFWFVYGIYQEYLSARWSKIALFFLAVNPYTLYMAINAELEMFLSFMCAAAFYCMLKESPLHMFFSAIASISKWNSVFIIPASALYEGLKKKKFSRFVWSGFVTGSLFLIWFVVMLIKKGVGSNSYVSEIAKRGPNIYRFYLDAVGVVSGFYQWVGLDIYRNGISIASIIGSAVVIISLPVLFVSLYFGFVFFIKKVHVLRYPVLTYLGGYFVIHMIYQNSKARYVLPILWLLHLLLFAGLKQLHDRYVTLFKNKRLISILLVSSAAAILLLSIFLVYKGEQAVLLFSGLLLFPLLVYFLNDVLHKGSYKKVPVLLAALILVLQVYYGTHLFRHYSERRVEFKQAGLILASIMDSKDRVLVSEPNVIKYYTGFKSKQIVLFSHFKSKNAQSYENELKAKHIRYIYVDDFYISRLKLSDKNAIDKNARLMESMRDHMSSSPLFTLVKKIQVGDSITGYLYEFKF